MAGKVLLKAGIIIVALVLVIIILAQGGMRLMKARHGDKQEILKAAESGAPKALVVYQPSVTSASGDVANAIASGLNDAGLEVTLNHPGDFLSADLSDYTVVVMGGPNYGSQLPEALREYAARVEDYTGKTVIIYSTSGATQVRTELDKLQALMRGAKPYAAVKFKFTESETNQKESYQLGLDAAEAAGQ